MKKTIIFPVHGQTTKKKLNYLDKLTARLTYATNLFLDFIEKNDTVKLSNLNKYKKEVKEITGLNSAHLQQCYMKAREVYKSYKKLKSRKSLPKFKNKKIPVWQDRRTFKSIEWKEGKLTQYWIKLATLKVREKIVVPLDYGYYQVKQMENAEIKSIAIIMKNKRFYVYIAIEKEVKQIQAHQILAIDL